MPLTECPECGADVGSMSAEEVKAHREHHWEGAIPFPRTNVLAVERSNALDQAYAEKFTAEQRAKATRTLRQGE